MKSARSIVLVLATSALGWGCSRPELCNPMDRNTDCGFAYSLLQLSSSTLPASGTTVNPCSELSSCIIFISLPWNGTFGGQPGIAGADARCNSDANKPANTGTYKALHVGGTSRRASVTATAGDGQIDWVLYASKEYRRSDGTMITTSSSARLFTFPLLNAISPSDIPGVVVWTGLASDWTTSASTCATWTDSSVGQFGFTATEYDLTSTAIQSGNFACNTQQALYCVQQ